ncbi:MAG: shikimate kinase, partial [Bacillota bacterium]|nr:shikimate kinase [Bacillota bacterium]
MKKRYGLIGASLIHSYSKEIHEALGKYEYELMSLTADEMKDFVGSREFDGLNVTIPYKQEVMALCDEISLLAREIGAVNTLYWRDAASSMETESDIEVGSKSDAGDATSSQASFGFAEAWAAQNKCGSPDAKRSAASCADGDLPGASPAVSGSRRLVGHNTDYEGFLYAADRAGIDFGNQTVLILGTGGTSRMAQTAAAHQGASRILVASRSAGSATLLSYDDLPQIADAVGIIVNTTPLGTYPDNGGELLSIKDFPNCHSVMDVIYNPFKTALLLEAERLGIRHTNGLPMLVAQATAAAGYFLGTPGAFWQENDRIIAKLQQNMQNLVLVGMPGCGKTTIGMQLAEKTGKPFIDMDREIEREAGMAIPEIFDAEGEAGFRDRESAVAARIGKEHGQIIATGGGAVLRRENVDALRQNGLVIHVRRPLEALATDGRPLSKNLDALKKMEEKRRPLYEAAADMTFENTDPAAWETLLT